MRSLPILLDLVVCGLTAYVLSAHGRRSAWRVAAGGSACIIGMMAPVCAVAVWSPEWMRAATVMMMVVGFYAFVEVTGVSSGCGTDNVLADEMRQLRDAAGRERFWLRFDRQFAAYVDRRHSQDWPVGGSS